MTSFVENQPTLQHQPRRRSADRPPTRGMTGRDWVIISGLLFVGLVPVAGSAFRFTQLATGAEITPENARFFAAPVPILFHVVGAILYATFGALQFAPGFRRQYRTWHRRTGWILIPAGFAVALSGLWMSHFYPLPEYDGFLLYLFRIFFGTYMVIALVLGADAIRTRNFASHGAWMMRAYAIGMGAGTQVFTALPWILLFGMPQQFPRALLMAAGWIINLAVAEWAIRKRRSAHRSRQGAGIAA